MMSLAITPSAATTLLRVDVTAYVASETTSLWGAALFRGTENDAIAAGFMHSTGHGAGPVCFSFFMVSGTTSAIIFKVNVGANDNTSTFNGGAGVSGNMFDGVCTSSIVITEYDI
jgi:hypothetical protein